MSRPLICVLLIASLLVNGFLPCCLMMVVAAPVVASEQGCHGNAAAESITEDATTDTGFTACQRCAQCLQPATALLNTVLIPSAQPEVEQAWPRHADWPDSPLTPLLRPPINAAATA